MGGWVGLGIRLDLVVGEKKLCPYMSKNAVMQYIFY
jgi:hypothetical protein